MAHKKIPFVFILLLMLCFVAFGKGLRNDFLIDDNALITDNILIKNLKLIPALFSQPFLSGYYRPIAFLSFAFDYFLWQLNPYGYHLTNILFHFFNSALLLILLYLLSKNFKLSVLTGALFAVHPLASLRVNYITGRHHLLAAFFMLAALIIFCFGYKKGKIRFYLLGSLFFIMALLSRESAILFPLYLSCALLLITKKGESKYLITPIILSLSISATYLSLRLKYFNPFPLMPPDYGAFFSAQAITAFGYAILRYASLIIFPRNMYMIYTIDPNVISGYKGILYVFLVIFAILVLLTRLRTNKIMLFASAWFLIGVLPLYGIMLSRPLMGLIMHDAYVYFASIGLLVILSIFLLRLNKLVNKKLWFAFLSAILLFFIINSNINNALWKNTKTYCLYWLERMPKNYIANLSLAHYFVEQGDFKQAKRYFKKGREDSGIEKMAISDIALPNKKRLSMIYNSLGVLSSKLGNKEEAVKYYRQAIAADSKNAKAHFNLGSSYLLADRIDKAAFHFNETIKYDPYHLNAHYNLALIYAKLGNEEKALKERKITLFLNPQLKLFK